MKLAFTIDVEEEGLFSGRYSTEEAPTGNITSLSLLDPMVSEFDLRPTLMVTYQAIRDQRHRDYISDLCRRWQGEIGAHLHPWNTPPLVDLPYRPPVPSEVIPKAVLAAKLDTLFHSLSDLGVVPTSFRMGRFNLGPQMLSLLSDTTIIVDSSVAPMRSYYGGPRHLAAPTDPYFPDPADPARPGESAILEVPLTILPVLPGAGALFGLLETLPFPPGPWAAWTARYLASLPAQPVWTGLRRLKLACRLHRRRGGRVLTVFLHSSELVPGGCPRHASPEQVAMFLQRLRAFLSWVRHDLQAEPVTLSELARLEMDRTKRSISTSPEQ
jgi:hypothetical protein